MTPYQDWQARLDELQAQQKLYAYACADIVYDGAPNWQGLALARAILYNTVSRLIVDHMNTRPSQYEETA